MSDYRLTMFDRLGPDAGVRVKVLGRALASFGLFIALFLAASQMLGGVPDIWRLVWAVVTATACTAAVTLATLLASDGAGEAYKTLMVEGASTPYEEQFSREQALVMQNRVADALILFEERIAADPAAVAPRIRAAELYAQEHVDAHRAAELFREVQRIPTVSPGDDVHASMRLVDLYLGPLGDRGRALVELRRLIDRHPSSAVANPSRAALARLKAELLAEEAPPA